VLHKPWLRLPRSIRGMSLLEQSNVSQTLAYSDTGVERYIEAYPTALFGSLTGYTYAHMAYSHTSHTLRAFGFPATLGVTLHPEANADAINIHTLPTTEGKWLVESGTGLLGVETVGGISDTSHFTLCPISYHRSRVCSFKLNTDSLDFQRSSQLSRVLLSRTICNIVRN
jgi:hypothetical protein